MDRPVNTRKDISIAPSCSHGQGNYISIQHPGAITHGHFPRLGQLHEESERPHQDLLGWWSCHSSRIHTRAHRLCEATEPPSGVSPSFYMAFRAVIKVGQQTRTTHGSRGRVVAQQGHPPRGIYRNWWPRVETLEKKQTAGNNTNRPVFPFSRYIRSRQQPARSAAVGGLLLSSPANKHMIPRRPFGVMIDGWEWGERGVVQCSARVSASCGHPCRGTCRALPQHANTRKLRAQQRRSSTPIHPSRPHPLAPACVCSGGRHAGRVWCVCCFVARPPRSSSSSISRE